MCQVLRCGSSENQILLQQRELLNKNNRKAALCFCWYSWWSSSVFGYILNPLMMTNLPDQWHQLGVFWTTLLHSDQDALYVILSPLLRALLTVLHEETLIHTRWPHYPLLILYMVNTHSVAVSCITGKALKGSYGQRQKNLQTVAEFKDSLLYLHAENT